MNKHIINYKPKDFAELNFTSSKGIIVDQTVESTD